MKVVKKLLALVLASALALTLLTGCSGGGGGGGGGSEKVPTAGGGSVIMGGTNNANSDFSRNLIEAIAEDNITMTYSQAKAEKAQDCVRAMASIVRSNPDIDEDELMQEVVKAVGLNTYKEMFFLIEQKSTTGQVVETLAYMRALQEAADEEGYYLDYDENTFGYVTLDGNGQKAIMIVVGYNMYY